MNAYLAFTFVTFILFLQTSLFFFFFMPRNRVNIAFALAALMLSVYAISIYILQQQHFLSGVQIADRIATAAIAMAMYVYNWLFYLLRGKNEKWIRNMLVWLILPILVAGTLLYFEHDDSIRFYFRREEFWLYFMHAESPLNLLLVPFIVLSITLAVTQIYKWDLAARTNREQLYVRFILATVLFTSIVNTSLEIISPLFSAYTIPSTAHFFALTLFIAVLLALWVLKNKEISNIALDQIIDKRIRCHVLYLDRNARIIRANGCFLDEFGYTKQELIDRNVDTIIFNRSGKTVWQLNGEVVNFFTSDGRSIPLKVSCVRITNKFRRIAGQALIGIDYREIVWLEQHLSDCEETSSGLNNKYDELTGLLNKRKQETEIAHARLIREINDMNLNGSLSKEFLREKDELISEMHHRVKNNMQMVASLTAFYGDSHDDLPHSQHVFTSIRERINRLAEIHDKLYALSSLSSIDFGEFLNTLSHRLQAGMKEPFIPEMRFDLANENLPFNEALACGMIAWELIENAMKHAFPAEIHEAFDRAHPAIVTIGFCRSNEEYCMIVKDNGVGMPYKDHELIIGGKGLKLVRLITDEHLHGRFGLKGLSGTCAEITFK